MRRTIVITDEAHPDTPANFYDSRRPRCWFVYVDGTPFIGVPLTDSERTWTGPAYEEACRVARQAIETGRYEYVDVALQPDRRTGDRRRETA